MRPGGMRSIVARTMHAPHYNERPSLTCVYYAYWSGIPLGEFVFHMREDRAMGAWPSNDGLALVFATWPNADFHEYRAHIEDNFMRTLDLVPALAELVRGGEREERFIGTGELPNFLRKPYGPGWALVGDAGYHRDPISAEGISDAFRDAELLAEAVDDGLSGRRPLEQALAGYEGRRNEAAMPMYEYTCRLAALDPPSPRLLEFYDALVGNQAETDRLFGTLAGTVPVLEVFSRENIERVIAASSLR